MCVIPIYMATMFKCIHTLPMDSFIPVAYKGSKTSNDRRPDELKGSLSQHCNYMHGVKATILAMRKLYVCNEDYGNS